MKGRSRIPSSVFRGRACARRTSAVIGVPGHGKSPSVHLPESGDDRTQAGRQSWCCWACQMPRTRQRACEPAGWLPVRLRSPNAEDLVLVPGTRSIVSSGMAEGASFFLIHSRSGAWRPLAYQVSRTRHFPLSPPPVLATFEHAWPQHSRPWSRVLPTVCRGTRCARGDRGV